MSGIVGKKNSTLKKESVKESKLLTVGVKSLRFWHEATVGETSIPFGSLTLPADILSQGLSNPTGGEIVSANLSLFHTNVEVMSSLNGKLMEGLTYVVKNSQITFVNGYVATEAEIFEVTYKNDVVTGTNVVDARPLTKTGVLTAGNTTFVVGEIFKTNAYPSEQLGEVLVFVDGVLQFRNTGNVTATPLADGNYQEVHATGGYGSAIEFNDVFGVDVNIQVISRNLIVERPDISMMQLIESLGGQLDKLIEYVAADIGVAETIFQAAPNQVDLAAFGNNVEQNKQDIATLQAVKNKWQTKYQAANLTSVTQDISELQFNNLTIGKTYLIGGSLNVTESNNQLILKFRSAPADAGTLYHHFEINTNTVAEQTFSLNKKFIATSTSMFVHLIAAGATILHGDSLVTGTHIQLTECNFDEEVSLF